MKRTSPSTPCPTLPPVRWVLARTATVLVAVVALGTAACQPAAPTTPTPGPASTTTSAGSPSTTTTTLPAPATWRVVGGDEFTGSTLDATRWKPYFNTYGDGNEELACLRPENLSLGGGTLKIRARAETVRCSAGTTEAYTSGFLGSREVGRYHPLEARYEIRAKLPHAQGLWPAFWLRHRNGASTAEVDVLEYFHSSSPGATSQTLHLGGRSNVAKKGAPFEAPTLTPGWHTWGVEISRVDADGDGTRDDVRFDFTVDGRATLAYIDTVHSWVDAAPADATWDLAVNLAVGGRWVGRPDGILGQLPDLGRCARSGTYPTCSADGIQRVDWSNSASTTYEVDWVRVSIRG